MYSLLIMGAIIFFAIYFFWKRIIVVNCYQCSHLFINHYGLFKICIRYFQVILIRFKITRNIEIMCLYATSHIFKTCLSVMTYIYGITFRVLNLFNSLRSCNVIFPRQIELLPRKELILLDEICSFNTIKCLLKDIDMIVELYLLRLFLDFEVTISQLLAWCYGNEDFNPQDILLCLYRGTMFFLVILKTSLQN